MSRKEKVLVVLGWVATALVSIKSIFMDFGVDNAYQLAMSYRHLQGDKMFLEMWEPHQTSIFVNDFLMWVYRLFVPSFEGVAIYIQVMGTILMLAVALVLYKTLKGRVGDFVLQFMCMGIVLFRVKQTPGIEFSNLFIAFSVLLFCTLMTWLNHKNQVRWILCLGILNFLQVLTYPSSVLISIIISIIVLKESSYKIRDFLAFAATNIALFGTYITYFLITIGPATLLQCFTKILQGDTHYDGTYREGFFCNFPQAIILLGVSASIGLIYGIANHFIAKGKLVASPIEIGILSAIVLDIAMVYEQRRTHLDFDRVIYIIPLAVILLSIAFYRNMDSGDRRLWIIGLIISVATFFSVMLLTDTALLTQVPYLILGGMVSLVPISKSAKRAHSIIVLIIALILCHRALVVAGYGNLGQKVIMTHEAENIVHKGPTIGIICDRENVLRAQEGYEDFQQYVETDDIVLVLSKDLYPLDSAVYMFGGHIANHSTMCFQYDNAVLTDYFAINPHKYPTVIAVACAYGNMQVNLDGYAMKWVNDHFTPVAEGKFWKFYRPNEAD
ncbi:MAG: hypothetical protein K6G72_06990 [Lachnospiraceae bacterium]|nr:hypothetical protein [Lachnospiraceae bacterium]